MKLEEAVKSERTEARTDAGGRNCLCEMAGNRSGSLTSLLSWEERGEQCPDQKYTTESTLTTSARIVLQSVTGTAPASLRRSFAQSPEGAVHKPLLRSGRRAKTAECAAMGPQRGKLSQGLEPAPQKG